MPTLENEQIYAVLALLVFAYFTYTVSFKCKIATDEENTKLIKAYAIAKKKGLLK